METCGRLGKWHLVEPGIEIDNVPRPARPVVSAATARRPRIPGGGRWRQNVREGRRAQRPRADTVGWGSEDDAGGLRQDRWKGGE